MERSRKGSGNEALVFVDRPAGEAGFPGRSRDIEQDEHSQITPPPSVLEIDIAAMRRAGHGLEVHLDCCVDVDIVALRLSPDME